MSTVFNFTFVPWFRSVAPYIHMHRGKTFVVAIAGIGALLSLFKTGEFASIADMVLRAVVGIGLIAGAAGGEALLWFALNRAVKMLGSYARLHYRLLKPEQDHA